MNKKGRIIFIVAAAVLLFALCIYLLVSGKTALPLSDSAADPSVQDEVEEGGMEGAPVLPNNIAANGAGISHPGTAAQSDPYSDYEEEWEYDDMALYQNDTLLVSNENGHITVGKPDAVIEVEQGGLILEMNYEKNACEHPFGIQVTVSDGYLGYADEGKFSYLYGSNPYIYLNGSGDILSGEQCVLLGRTWDQQRSLKYVDGTQFGLCWFASPMATEPLDRAELYIKVFDLLEYKLIARYVVEIEYSSDNAYHLTSISPYQEDIDKEIAADLRANVTNQIQIGTICAVSATFTDEDIFIEPVSAPYWNDAVSLKRTPLDVPAVTLYGKLYAVTVNTNSIAVGPETFYYTVGNIPSDDPEVETEVRIDLVGYDWAAPMRWDVMMRVNGIEKTTYTYRNYAP